MNCCRIICYFVYVSSVVINNKIHIVIKENHNNLLAGETPKMFHVEDRNKYNYK